MATKKKASKKRTRSNVVELRPTKKPRKKVKRKPKPKPTGPKFRLLSEFEAYKLLKSQGLQDLHRIDINNLDDLTTLRARGIEVKTRKLDRLGRPLKKKRKAPSTHSTQRRQFARRKKAATGKKTDFSPNAQAARVVAVVVSLDSRRGKKKI